MLTRRVMKPACTESGIEKPAFVSSTSIVGALLPHDAGITTFPCSAETTVEATAGLLNASAPATTREAAIRKDRVPALDMDIFLSEFLPALSRRVRHRTMQG